MTLVVALLMILELTVVLPQLSHGASDFKDGIRELTKALIAEAAKQKIQRLVVTDFTNLEGTITPLGRFLAEELSASLAMTGSVQVVDRQQINQALREQSKAGLPLLDPTALKKLGKVSQLHALVTGSVLELANSIRITVKVISIENVSVTATAKTTLPKTGVLAELGKSVPVEEAPQPEQDNTAPEGMVLIPAGPFIYGEEDSKQTIALPAFWMDVFEVTNADYAKIRGHNFDTEKANHPVTNVSWNQAAIYCRAKGKRLPSEQEWEKAARGTDSRRYPWGNTYSPKLVNAEGRQRDTTPVGQFPDGKSPYGLQDMAGNAMEWTISEEEEAKVFRGGSWASSATDVRTTYRGRSSPAYRLADLGFRCAKDGPPSP